MKSAKKVMIIEDDPAIHKLLKAALTSAGYDISVAEGGAEALGKISMEKPDLLILDIMLPTIDGWEICRFVKEHGSLSNTKILILTAKNTYSDKMIGKDILKADEYMTKPFNLDNVLDTVNILLAGQK